MSVCVVAFSSLWSLQRLGSSARELRELRERSSRAGYTRGVEGIATIQVDVEPGWRGGQRQVYLLCTGLARRGHPVVAVVRRGGELGRRLREAGIETVEVPGRSEADPSSVRTLARLFRQRRSAVAGIHSGRSLGIAAIARLLAGTAAPPLVPTRRVDFAIGRNPFSRWKYSRAAAGIIAISEAVAGVLERSGIPRSRIRIVHSGVVPPEIPEGARERFRRQLGVAEDRVLAGTVAALTDHKGHRYLLEAIPAIRRRHPEALFLLVGDGELREPLEARARELGLDGDAVRFLGHRTDVPVVLGGLDLFVMASHMEGLGTAILDAQMAGLPVVATRAGGIPEIVRDGETGLLAEPRDPVSLAAAVVRLLDDPALARRLARTGQALALERFSADAMVEGTLEAYRAFTTVRG